MSNGQPNRPPISTTGAAGRGAGAGALGAAIAQQALQGSIDWRTALLTAAVTAVLPAVGSFVRDRREGASKGSVARMVYDTLAGIF